MQFYNIMSGGGEWVERLKGLNRLKVGIMRKG